MDPLLKWVGGKRWQVPLLKMYYQADRRLVEPFCGGLSIALGLEPRMALLNDINPHLINFYRQVQAEQYTRWNLPAAKPELYMWYRAVFNGAHLVPEPRTDAQMAELFFILNHWCFNGLWRVNAAGKFNVPPRPELRPLPAPDFAAYAAKFNTWQFSTGDFESLRLSDDDFIYCDPPYDATFSNYDSSRFIWEDHVRLAEWLEDHPGPACVCNAMTDRIVALYEKMGWHWVELESRQQMQASRGRTDRVTEILAFNAQFAIDRARARVHDRQETLQ